MSLEQYARERLFELPQEKQMRAALRMAQFGDFARSISVAESDLEIVGLTLSYLASGYSSECSIVGTNHNGTDVPLDMRHSPSIRTPPDFLREAVTEAFVSNKIIMEQDEVEDKLYCAVPLIAYAGADQHKMGAFAMMRDSAFACTNSEMEIIRMLPAIIGSNLGKYMLKQKTEKDDGFPEAHSRGTFFNRDLPKSLDNVQTGKDACLIYFDLDDFKAVNDGYGHNMGDQVLKQVISAITGMIPIPLYRIGGDEFTIISPGNLNTGQSLAETVRKEIVEHDYIYDLPPERKTPNVSASLGVTQYRSSDTIETVTSRADKALYIAKNTEKNQVATLL